MIEFKKCSICCEDKPVEKFGPDKRKQNGLRSECKDCRKNYYYNNHNKMLEDRKKDYHKHKLERNLKLKEKYQQNPERFKQRSNNYYNNNKEKIKLKLLINRNERLYQRREKRRIQKTLNQNQTNYQNKLLTPGTIICSKCKTLKLFPNFSQNITGPFGLSRICKTCCKILWQQYYNKKSAQLLSNGKIYRKNNPDKIRTKKKNYYHNKLKHDPQYMIPRKIMRRIRKFLKGIKSYPEIARLTGCSFEYLEKYLRNTMDNSMTWDQFMNGKLHIDHIKPICSFNLLDDEQLKQCFHYSNLRLLHAKDNIAKCTQDKKLKLIIK